MDWSGGVTVHRPFLYHPGFICERIRGNPGSSHTRKAASWDEQKKSTPSSREKPSTRSPPGVPPTRSSASNRTGSMPCFLGVQAASGPAAPPPMMTTRPVFTVMFRPVAGPPPKSR